MGWLPQCILQELPDGQRWMPLGLHEETPVCFCGVVSLQLFPSLLGGLELLTGLTGKSCVWGVDQSNKKLV